MRSLHSRNRYLSLAVSAGLALTFGSTLAQSETLQGERTQGGKNEAAKSVAAQSTGVMTFANVQVVNQPQAATASQTGVQPYAQGMRAYMDPATRRLREETNEDRQKNAEKHAARDAAKASRTGSGAQEEAGTRTLYGAGGAIGVQLTEEHLIYQVAHKTNDGLVQEEVTGKTAAQKALRSGKTRTSVEKVGGEQ